MCPNYERAFAFICYFYCYVVVIAAKLFMTVKTVTVVDLRQFTYIFVCLNSTIARVNVRCFHLKFNLIPQIQIIIR